MTSNEAHELLEKVRRLDQLVRARSPGRDWTAAWVTIMCILVATYLWMRMKALRRGRRGKPKALDFRTTVRSKKQYPRAP